METSPPLDLVQYRLLVEHSPTMVWRSGLDALCNYFNSTWLRFTGRTLEQELGVGWMEGVHPEDLGDCKETYLAHFERRESFHMEYRLRRHDGVYRYISDRGVPYEDEQGSFAGFIGSCVDIHERREADRAKATFLALAAHELRTPLGAVKLKLESLRRQLARGVVPTDEVLNRMGVQLHRADLLVQDLEDAGRVNANMPLLMRKEELELGELVQSVVMNHREALALRTREPPRHTLELSIAPGTYFLRADRQRLEQVMNNLLTNAVKYSPQGGIIRVTLAREGSDFRLSVSDPGIGIPAADIPALTQRYFRASNVSAQGFSGLGLGLSLVREILEAHGGQLDIQSEQGRGTTVTVILPLSMKGALT